MNKVLLVGRLTRDPDVRYANDVQVARFSVAVDRKYSKEKQADFPNCVAFGKTAEFVSKYFHKGMKIGIEGRIQTGNYTNKEGVKVYTTDIVCEAVEFVESKQSQEQAQDQDGTEWLELPDGAEEDLPFN